MGFCSERAAAGLGPSGLKVMHQNHSPKANNGIDPLTPSRSPVRISGPLVSRAMAMGRGSEKVDTALRTFSMVPLWYWNPRQTLLTLPPASACCYQQRSPPPPQSPLFVAVVGVCGCGCVHGGEGGLLSMVPLWYWNPRQTLLTLIH